MSPATRQQARHRLDAIEAAHRTRTAATYERIAASLRASASRPSELTLAARFEAAAQAQRELKDSTYAQ